MNVPEIILLFVFFVLLLFLSRQFIEDWKFLNPPHEEVHTTVYFFEGRGLDSPPMYEIPKGYEAEVAMLDAAAGDDRTLYIEGVGYRAAPSAGYRGEWKLYYQLCVKTGEYCNV